MTREIVELDPWAPAWPELAPWLARAELRGELRRGYFVEGFSGVQYATEEAAAELARLAGEMPSSATSDVLLAAADPANLYGSGAPFDIPLLEGGTARLSRIPGNFLVLRGGRPVLIIEAHGKRLTGLASASQAGARRRARPASRSSPGPRGRSSRSRPTTASPPSPAQSRTGSPSSVSSVTIPAWRTTRPGQRLEWIDWNPECFVRR